MEIITSTIKQKRSTQNIHGSPWKVCRLALTIEDLTTCLVMFIFILDIGNVHVERTSPSFKAVPRFEPMSAQVGRFVTAAR